MILITWSVYVLENLNGSLCLNGKQSLLLNVSSELTNNNTSRQYFTCTHGFHEPQKQPAVDKWQQQKYKMSAHVCRREVGEVWGLWGFGELLWLLFCSFTTTCKHPVLESAVTLLLKTHGCWLRSTELYTVFLPNSPGEFKHFGIYVWLQLREQEIFTRVKP